MIDSIYNASRTSIGYGIQRKGVVNCWYCTGDNHLLFSHLNLNLCEGLISIVLLQNFKLKPMRSSVVAVVVIGHEVLDDDTIS